jgi:hypothetical protein
MFTRWKIFLPERWREACALNSDGIMDPNLTLAHITHNTAVGLLHQGIAYPSQEWQSSPIRLPSVSSAETCLAAATEVAVIAEKYLQGSVSLTNPQFAFCLFISGRMLLAHSFHYNISLPTQFDSLTNSLFEISRRWNGPHVRHGAESETENLASKFASRLVRARYKDSSSLDIRQAVYSEEQGSDGNSVTPSRNLRSRISNIHPSHGIMDTFPPPVRSASNSGLNENGNLETTIMMDQEDSPDSISLAFPPLPPAFQPHCVSSSQTRMPSPVPNQMEANSFYGQQGNSGFGSTYSDLSTMEYGAGAGNGSRFEDLSSFFEYPFVPNQRISMFSGPLVKDSAQQT